MAEYEKKEVVVDGAKMTPMMKQYREMKAKYGDAILFFRLGDFYEMFFEDALEASRLLQITLTSRSKGDKKAPMCGVPHHAADGYIAKLTKMGKKVAICEQLTDPSLPGIVERDVIRIITPGTTLDENVLEQKSNNFIAAVTLEGAGFGFSYADISTGEFGSAVIGGIKELEAEIARLAPSEIIMPEAHFVDSRLTELRKSFDTVFFFPFRSELEADGRLSARGAAEFLMEYLKATQKTNLDHLTGTESYRVDKFMPLDDVVLRNLEILSTMREGRREGSLLWVLDKTKTAMGGRMLKYFLLHPLLDTNEINLRLESVDELTKKLSLKEDLEIALKRVMDVERLISRLSLGRGNARDLVALKNSLRAVPRLKNILSDAVSPLLTGIRDGADPVEDVADLISAAIADEPPAVISEGGMIRDGYNAELDELRAISRTGKDFISNLQREEIEKTGINNLKVRYNKVFGYYIEVSKGQVGKVPETYIRKQTLVNAERYITPKLKEFEEKVLGAEEKIKELELKLFTEVREKTVMEMKRIQSTAKNLALLDVICSFAAAALENRYCRPVVNESGDIEIIGGRHPVVEKMNTDGGFVPNDTHMQKDGERMLLITGPNMGGKSTYLRQTALIVLMAQTGCFVPAERAVIGLADRIFTRVGASDNLVRGQSTFMVEMKETSFILENATERSLIILDEVGRGTSTYDGMSIAWAIFEYIHDKIGARTLFATHYHELIALADKLPRAANFAAAVSGNDEDGVVFLYKVIAGGADRSYGIEVAKLAGLPQALVARAKQILTDLEEGVLESGIKNELNDANKRVPSEQIQHPLLAEDAAPDRTHSAIKELKEIDLNVMTPIEALNRLASIKENL